MIAPENIRVIRDESVLLLKWPGGEEHRLPFLIVRGECPCASCVDEFSGVRRLDVSSLPLDVHPTAVEFAGNYAIKITWSDGHDTGLYTWERLAMLCERYQDENH